MIVFVFRGTEVHSFAFLVIISVLKFVDLPFLPYYFFIERHDACVQLSWHIYDDCQNCGLRYREHLHSYTTSHSLG